MNFRAFVAYMSTAFDAKALEEAHILPEDFMMGFAQGPMETLRARSGYEYDAWDIEVTHDGVNPGNLGLILKATPKQREEKMQ